MPGEPRLFQSTFVGDGATSVYSVDQPISYYPQVVLTLPPGVGGNPGPGFEVIPQSLKQVGVDAPNQNSWYWEKDSTTLSQGTSTALPNTAILSVNYQSELSNNVAVTTVPTQITDQQTINTLPDPLPPDPLVNPVDTSSNYVPPDPSGIWQSPTDVPGITDIPSATTASAGITRRASVIPVQLDFETDYPTPRVGDRITTTHPALGLSGSLLIQSVTLREDPMAQGSDLGHGSTFRRTVGCVLIQYPDDQSPADPSGSTTSGANRTPVITPRNWRSALNRQAAQQAIKPPGGKQSETCTAILGAGGDLIAGVDVTNRRQVLHSGTATGPFWAIAQHAPVGQSLLIDVLLNGSSIFTSPITIAAGNTSRILSTGFVQNPMRFQRGDIIDISTSYTVTGGGSVTAAVNVTIQGEWYW